MASNAAEQQLLTVDEFMQLEIAERAELIDGMIVEDEGMATGVHGYVSLNLGSELKAWGRSRGRAFVETQFKLFPDREKTRRPDISFVFGERLEGADLMAGAVELAPDLAAEVLSPSDTQQRITEKLDDYLAAGVRLVWLINPFQRYVVAHAPDQPPRLYPSGTTLDGGDVLPGFEMPVEALFE